MFAPQQKLHRLEFGFFVFFYFVGFLLLLVVGGGAPLPLPVFLPNLDKK